MLNPVCAAQFMTSCHITTCPGTCESLPAQSESNAHTACTPQVKVPGELRDELAKGMKAAGRFHHHMSRTSANQDHTHIDTDWPIEPAPCTLALPDFDHRAQ